jgi:peptidoglycan/xylan/chitin deacetylase (PgdA/CDA1 family)
VWRGREDVPAVALTFDDGPTPDTERILDLLERHRLTATFFMVGRQVERYPHIARRISAEGHTVGNHSYSHPIYLYRSTRETYRQLARTQQAIEEAASVRPTWSRPPCGVRSRAYFAAARRLGLQTVQWTVAGGDWKYRDPLTIVREVVDRAAPGSIVLLHDGDSAGRQDRRNTVAALPLIMSGLRRKGLSVAPLASLIESPGQSPGPESLQKGAVA